MNIIFKRVIPLIILLLVFSCNTYVGNENTTISIRTSMGEIKVKLYDDTPIHRDNFIKLVKSGFYEGISFHRIIKDFMIQAGDPLTKTGGKAHLPDSLTKYTIPAEINNHYFHKKGALAAAREGNETNPEMRSSGTQFYIVQGVTFTDEELNKAEQLLNSNMKQTVFNTLLKQTSDSVTQTGTPVSSGEIQQIASMKMYLFLTNYKEFKVSEDRRNIYKTLGGTPRLDGTYTVFGEVTEGLNIIDRIASVATDSSDKPVTDVIILKMKIIKN